MGLQAAAIAGLWLVSELATWLPKVVFPDAAHHRYRGTGAAGSVLDDILKSPPDGAPAPSRSPPDQILDQPPADKSPASDPILDRLLKGN